MNHAGTVKPSVGIIADDSLQGHLLATAVRSQGFELLVNTDPEQLERERLADGPALWIVDLNQEDRWEAFLDELLEQASAPILFTDGQAPGRHDPGFARWERRLLSKMLDYVERPRVDESLETFEAPAPTRTIPTPREFTSVARGEMPERVWVLGASLGGPAAVKVFLDALPAELPVAFVLAQHIDEGFLDTLSRVLCRDNGFECAVGYAGESLRHGRVLIAPVDGEITVDASGRLHATEREWEGPYAPSIDQVMQNVSDSFGARASAILFSGMGNDGAISAPVLASRGGQVWAQSAETCAASSQPDSARDTGAVGYSGSPEDLAAQLVDHVRRELQSPGVAS